VALIAAVTREGARIDTRRKNLTASCQDDAVYRSFTRDNREDMLKFGYRVDIEPSPAVGQRK